MYAWIITRDNINDADVSIIGPSTAPDELIVSLRDGKGKPFRLLDDDGEVYYEGRILDEDEEFDFEPLDDYGTAQGCTDIQYRLNNGIRWLSL